MDLESLDRLLEKRSLNLPIIQNRKRVGGAGVIQLETAMGAAIGSFPRARGLKVGRDRFFPTKKIEDLFVLQSDACVLDSMNRLRRNSERPQWLSFMPAVSFDSKFLDSPLKIGERFEDPTSVSLVQAGSLKISGPVFVGRDVKIRGEVEIVARPGRIYRIAPGCVLTQGRYPRNRYGEMGGT